MISTKRAFYLLLSLLILLTFTSQVFVQSRHASRTRKKKECKVDKPFKLPSGCNLPFEGREGLDVDKHCPMEGCNNNEADQIQNRFKNNLCATGKPVQVSFNTFDKM